MDATDQSLEQRQQLGLLLWWLVGTLVAFFLAGCFLDVGIVLAFPAIALVSGTAWLALLAKNVGVSWRDRSDRRRAFTVALASLVGAVTCLLLLVPTAGLSAYVQVQGLLLINGDTYRRDIRRAEAKGPLDAPLTWVYGGWLSFDRAIVYWPADNPSERLKRNLDAGSTVNCRWLRASYYDCTIDY